jgi:hypothetical protein
MADDRWHSGFPKGPPQRPTTGAPAELRCSFCGKPRAAVRRLIAGPTPAVAICNECVALCVEINAEQDGASGEPA